MRSAHAIALPPRPRPPYLAARHYSVLKEDGRAQHIRAVRRRPQLWHPVQALATLEEQSGILSDLTLLPLHDEVLSLELLCTVKMTVHTLASVRALSR